MENEKKKFPEGHFTGMWTGIGIAIFSGVGIPLSVALGNPAFIGIGPALGVAIGAGIGASIEKKKKQEGLVRPLTDEEKRGRKRLVNIALLILALGAAAFILVFALGR